MARNLPNPQGLTICCNGCGRDTKSKTGFCAACSGFSTRDNREQRGRPARSTYVIGGQAEMLDDGDDDPDKDE